MPRLSPFSTMRRGWQRWATRRWTSCRRCTRASLACACRRRSRATAMAHRGLSRSASTSSLKQARQASYRSGGFLYRNPPWLKSRRLIDKLQRDLPNAALHADVDCYVGRLIGVVGVDISILIEACHVEAAQAAADLDTGAHVSAEHEGGAAHPAADVGVKAFVIITRQNDDRLARAHLDVQRAQSDAG